MGKLIKSFEKGVRPPFLLGKGGQTPFPFDSDTIRKKLLSEWPIPEPSDYLSFVNIPQMEEEEVLKGSDPFNTENRRLGNGTVSSNLTLSATLNPHVN